MGKIEEGPQITRISADSEKDWQEKLFFRSAIGGNPRNLRTTAPLARQLLLDSDGPWGGSWPLATKDTHV